LIPKKGCVFFLIGYGSQHKTLELMEASRNNVDGKPITTLLLAFFY
tara:strand:- start:330 stop:467 length:138 start_codon:yes stop_codon:yes gene_type:complete